MIADGNPRIHKKKDYLSRLYKKKISVDILAERTLYRDLIWVCVNIKCIIDVHIPTIMILSEYESMRLSAMDPPAHIMWDKVLSRVDPYVRRLSFTKPRKATMVMSCSETCDILTLVECLQYVHTLDQFPA